MKRTTVWMALLMAFTRFAFAEAHAVEDLFKQRNPDAPALHALIDYVEAVTDPDSPDFMSARLLACGRSFAEPVCDIYDRGIVYLAALPATRPKKTIRQYAQTPLTYPQLEITLKATLPIVSISSSKHTIS